ncbi:hypothetical protein LCGC14_2081140 [marine sediment metagenome]|uniref:Uncharacterized protein n=1 Tax=marine sediment metagenome TaxID=412755 RepID=A0A0F9EFH6_9ZZZZ
MKKPLKLPRKTSKAYREIFRQGHMNGYQRGLDTAQDTADKVVVKNDMEVEKYRVEGLKLAGQAVESLARLGEAYARIIMYGSDQRYPKKNERQGF